MCLLSSLDELCLPVLQSFAWFIFEFSRELEVALYVRSLFVPPGGRVPCEALCGGWLVDQPRREMVQGGRYFRNRRSAHDGDITNVAQAPSTSPSFPHQFMTLNRNITKWRGEGLSSHRLIFVCRRICVGMCPALYIWFKTTNTQKYLREDDW